MALVPRGEQPVKGKLPMHCFFLDEHDPALCTRVFEPAVVDRRAVSLDLASSVLYWMQARRAAGAGSDQNKAGRGSYSMDDDSRVLRLGKCDRAKRVSPFSDGSCLEEQGAPAAPPPQEPATSWRQVVPQASWGPVTEAM